MIFSVQRITEVCLGYENRACACFFIKCFGVCLFGVFGFGCGFFLVFSLGFFVLVWIFVVVVCLFPVFLNEEFFLSAEQLLKQWIMIYFCGI